MTMKREIALVSARQKQREACYAAELEALERMVKRLRDKYTADNEVLGSDVEKMALWAVGVAVRAGEVTELRILVEDLTRSES